MDTTVKYNEPWIMQRADPFVLLGEDGWYYFSASVPAYDKIILRRAKSLSELANATEKTIWEKHESGDLRQLPAPSILSESAGRVYANAG